MPAVAETLRRQALTTTDHLSCAILCRQNIQDRKSRMASAASPDNRDRQHHQETSRGNRRSPWGSPYRPAAESEMSYPPSANTSIAAFIRIPHFYFADWYNHALRKKRAGVFPFYRYIYPKIWPSQPLVERNLGYKPMLPRTHVSLTHSLHYLIHY